MNFKPFLALEASAGSGKTFALVVRFVALILKGAKINEILAITFTRKAAKEMKTRVNQCFLELENKINELNELSKILNKTKEEILELRNDKKSQFIRSDLKIMTFDTFFTKIVRAFSLNLGLMSDFDITEQKNNSNIKMEFYNILDEKLLNKLVKYIYSSKKENELNNFFDNLELLYKYAYKNNEYKDIKYPQDKLELINIAYKKLKEYIKEKYESKLENDKNFGKNFAIDEINEKNIIELAQKPIISDLNKKYFKFILDDPKFIELQNNCKSILNIYAKEHEKYKIKITLSYLENFIKAKNVIIQKTNSLDFNDISIKAHELSSKNELKDMIYFRLDGYIAHLLIDEFQDTNILQYQILKPLIAEIVSGEGTRKFKSFFYVGDKKQSIYKFRGAKKELFDLLLLDFPQIKKEELEYNYRSKKNLVNFVNDCFKNKYKNYILQKSSNNDDGFIRIVDVNGIDEDIFDINFNILLEQINLFKDHNNTCILCWKNKDADKIVEELRKKGIKAYTQSNIKLDKKANVKILIEYAKYCLFGDEFYKEFLKATIGEEFERIKLRLNEPIINILLFLVKKLKLDLSDIALIQFFEYASKKDNFFEILFEENIENVITNEDYGICVMTIHKSKGLEFDNVIIMDKISKDQNDTDNMIIEYENNQLYIKIKDRIRKSTQEEEYQLFLDKQEKYEKEDKLNQIYVAFTRAKNNLIIIKNNIKIKHSSITSIFDGFDFKYGDFGSLNESNDIKINNNINTKNNLQKFENIPLQNKKTRDFTKNKDIDFGVAFHYFLQNLDFENKDNFDILCKDIRLRFYHFLNEEDFDDLFLRISILLKNEQFINLLNDKKLLKEQDISFKGEHKKIDLLAIGDNEAIVFDYKTGISNKEENKKQINLYKQAIQEILKKKKTQAFIIYCLKDKIILDEV